MTSLLLHNALDNRAIENEWGTPRMPCSCTRGCKNNRCGCRKKGIRCAPGRCACCRHLDTGVSLATLSSPSPTSKATKASPKRTLTPAVASPSVPPKVSPSKAKVKVKGKTKATSSPTPDVAPCENLPQDTDDMAWAAVLDYVAEKHAEYISKSGRVAGATRGQERLFARGTVYVIQERMPAAAAKQGSGTSRRGSGGSGMWYARVKVGWTAHRDGGKRRAAALAESNPGRRYSVYRATWGPIAMVVEKAVHLYLRDYAVDPDTVGPAKHDGRTEWFALGATTAHAIVRTVWQRCLREFDQKTRSMGSKAIRALATKKITSTATVGSRKKAQRARGKRRGGRGKRTTKSTSSKTPRDHKNRKNRKNVPPKRARKAVARKTSIVATTAAKPPTRGYNPRQTYPRWKTHAAH